MDFLPSFWPFFCTDREAGPKQATQRRASQPSEQQFGVLSWYLSLYIAPMTDANSGFELLFLHLLASASSTPSILSSIPMYYPTLDSHSLLFPLSLVPCFLEQNGYGKGHWTFTMLLFSSLSSALCFVHHPAFTFCILSSRRGLAFLSLSFCFAASTPCIFSRLYTSFVFHDSTSSFHSIISLYILLLHISECLKVLLSLCPSLCPAWHLRPLVLLRKQQKDKSYIISNGRTCRSWPLFHPTHSRPKTPF